MTSARDVIGKWIHERLPEQDGAGDRCELCREDADRLSAALEAAGFEIVHAHKWEDRMSLGKCCVHCGIVQRSDGRHLPCLGPVHIRLRKEPTP